MNDLLDTADIARMLGVSREHCTNRLIKRPDFPKPAMNLSRRLRRWRKQDIVQWLLKAKPQCQQPTPDSTRTKAGANHGALTPAPAA